MARIDDWQRLWEKTVEIESEITKIALAGTALVPRPGDLTELLGLGRKLERISKGRNILLFDKLGRPGIFVVFPCDFKARQEYLSDNNRIFETKTDGAGYYCDLHPAFIVNKKGISRLLVGKYQCGAYRTSSGGERMSLYLCTVWILPMHTIHTCLPVWKARITAVCSMAIRSAA